LKGSAPQTVLNASHRVCLKKMADTGNECNELSLSESTGFEDYDKTSDSSSVLQSSPKPQQLGSSQTDQNLSKKLFFI